MAVSSVAVPLAQYPGGSLIPMFNTNYVSNPAYAAVFVNATTVVVPGSTHQLGTANLLVAVYDSATGTRNLIVPDSVSIDSTAYDVTVTFVAPQSGILIVQG